MKSILFIFSFFIAGAQLSAQELMAYVSQEKVYINYTVHKNERIEDVALKYGVTAVALKAINKLNSNSDIEENQFLKIPIADIIKPICKGNNCTKVYYEVQSREGLYRIGKNCGDTKVEQLKQLNNLSSESVTVGQKLLIGYIVMDEAAVRQVAGENNINIDEHTVVAMTQLVKDEITGQQPPVESTVSMHIQLMADSLKHNGYVKSFFEAEYKAGKTESRLNAGVFKSESGWADGKFYALMNNVPTSTIIKINNPLSSSFIYAKVLGPLPEINGNTTIKLRISSAGAAALSIEGEAMIEVIITY